MGKSGSAPPAPDYKGAATATSASQKVSQYTPYGNQIYSQNGVDSQGNPTWRSDISLAPAAQTALDSQLNLSSGLGGIANSQLPGVQQQYSQPMDLSSVQDVADKAYGAFTSRLDPQWDARTTQQETKLVNQGLRPGDEAYTNAMRDFGNARNDAYQQANLGAIQTMPQTYNLASQQYLQPLNVLNALRSGAQVQNPQFGQQQGTNYLGAAQAQGQYDQGVYSADVASKNSMNSGLAQLGSAGLLAFALSDRRLKKNVERVGDVNGIPWYRFDYIWGERSQGVMADEVLAVKPEAVFEVGGYLVVDYARL